MFKSMRRCLVAVLVMCLLLAPCPAFATDLIALNSSGEDVLRIQQRLIELQYFAFKCTGTFGGMTRQSIIQFQSMNNIMADGTVGTETLDRLFSHAAAMDKLPVRNPIGNNVKIPIGSSASAGNVPPVLGSDVNWKEVDPLMKTGESYQLTDLTDQKTLHVIRTGGVNHARIETASTADTAVFKSIFGGEYNWSKRPVIITVGTVRYAASLQGMPSGADHVDGNGMTGSCALYFLGSLSDIASLPDVEHRSTVLKAANASSWE